MQTKLGFRRCRPKRLRNSKRQSWSGAKRRPKEGGKLSSKTQVEPSKTMRLFRVNNKKVLLKSKKRQKKCRKIKKRRKRLRNLFTFLIQTSQRRTTSLI